MIQSDRKKEDYTDQPQLGTHGHLSVNLVHPAMVGEQQLEEVANEADGGKPHKGAKQQSAQVLAQWEWVAVDAGRPHTQTLWSVI